MVKKRVKTRVSPMRGSEYRGMEIAGEFLVTATSGFSLPMNHWNWKECKRRFRASNVMANVVINAPSAMEVVE